MFDVRMGKVKDVEPHAKLTPFGIERNCLHVYGTLDDLQTYLSSGFDVFIKVDPLPFESGQER